MALAVWSDKLLIGIEFVDRDHQGLFALVNRLHDAMTQQKGREVVGLILKELHDYANNHFSREEAMLEERHYPGLSAHKRLHVEFVGKVDEIKAKYESGSNLVSIDLLKFLRTWLVGHIAEDDKLYREYLLKVGKL